MNIRLLNICMRNILIFFLKRTQGLDHSEATEIADKYVEEYNNEK